MQESQTRLPPRVTNRIRVIDLETTGSASSDVCEIGWQDVVQEDEARWVVNSERGAIYVDPGRPISAQTMAIHHIRDGDVAGARFWKDAAPPILKPAGGVVALAAHRADFEQRYCTPRLSGGARWICTWKCALRVWPDMPGFSNQVLRYARMPDGLDHETGLPAHRALPDAYVTAYHLRDMLKVASVEQLLSWSDEPGLLPRVPTGPERGKPWARLTDEALSHFTEDRDENIRFSAQAALNGRHLTGEPAMNFPSQASLL
jgi:exodeoxyribonuclease X